MSSSSEYTQIGYLSDLSEFCAPSYGLVADFRLEPEQIGAKSDEFDRRLNPKVQNRTVTRHTEVRKVHKIPY